MFHSAPSRNHRIVLNFTFMDTECTYDYLFVYDGDSYQSTLLASLSGKTLPQPIEAKSGKVSPQILNQLGLCVIPVVPHLLLLKLPLKEG